MILLNDKKIEVIRDSKDQYGRTLCWLVVESDMINNRMVEAGYAWWYEYYFGDSKELEKHQVNAKSKKAWIMGWVYPTNPYEWRKSHK